jgi:hypothetical protein
MSHQQPHSNSSTHHKAGGSAAGGHSEPSLLATVLDVNEAIQQTVEQSAAELVMINTVLEQELPADIQSGDVAQALERAHGIEATIHQTAQELAEVNQALAEEIDHRMDLERQLAAAKSALAQAKKA